MMSARTKHRIAMTDILYLGITAAFFIISALYVRFCEQL